MDIDFDFIDLAINKAGIPKAERSKRLMEMAYKYQEARKISLFEGEGM